MAQAEAISFLPAAFIRKTAGTVGNFPVLGADPTNPVDGDVWITNIAGTRSLKVRIAGATYAVTLT
jgi:hypothetical protein